VRGHDLVDCVTAFRNRMIFLNRSYRVTVRQPPLLTACCGRVVKGALNSGNVEPQLVCNDPWPQFVYAIDRMLGDGGCGYILGLSYAAIPRLCRYSTGLREPSETLIRFALYQRMYESTISMN
jgi:hypothetical protein